MGVSAQIEEQVSELEKPVVLVSVSPLRYQEALLDTLRYFSQRFGTGLYITLNKPTSTLIQYFAKVGVQAQLVFLDSITNIPEQETETCCFLGRMRELSEISMGVSKMVSGKKEIRFILFDSVSTLLIYNDPKSVVRFCHMCAERLRSWGLSAAFLSVEVGEGMDMIAQLAQFCDAYVKAES
jgi:hypothetical protein